jgi:hypothetical protein
VSGVLDWANRFDAMARSSFLDGTKRQVATDGLALTAKCFATTTDPYGVPWTGLKTPRPGGPVEDKTGAMKNGCLAGPVAEGVRFYFAAPYAGYQHFGTKTNPARRLLPRGFLGLPASWSAMIQRAFNQQIRLAAAH